MILTAENKYFAFLVFTFLIIFHTIVASKEKKCLVCQQVMRDIVKSIQEENPHKTIQVGSFRIEPDGSQKQNTIKYAGSEVHLQEMFENICDKMNDYAQARHKQTKKLAILNLAAQINELQDYDLIRDPDLNRSLKFYCESIIEDFEDNILEAFKSSVISAEEAINKVCFESSDEDDRGHFPHAVVKRYAKKGRGGGGRGRGGGGGGGRAGGGGGGGQQAGEMA